MSVVGDAWVRVHANTHGFRGEVESGVRDGFKNVRNIVGGAFAVAGAFEFVKHVAEAAASQQEELAAVEQAIKQLNAAWEVHGKTVTEVLREQALASGYTVGELSQGFNRIVFGVKDTEKALNVLNVSMDISRAQHRNLTQVVVAVSRAVQGNLQGLSRYGVVLKNMKFSADPVIRGQEILAELAKRFGGEWQAYAGTAEGAMKRFHEAINELEVALGSGLLPGITRVLTASSNWVQHMEELYNTNARFRNQVQTTWHTVSDTIGGVVETVRVLWATFGDDISAGMRIGIQYLEAGLRTIRGIFEILSGILHGDWRLMWKGLNDLLGGALGQMVARARQDMLVLASTIGRGGRALVDAFTFSMGSLVEVLNSAVADLIAFLVGLPADLAARGYESGKSIASGILQGFYDNLPTTFVGEFLGDVIYDAQQKIEAHSPSDVFAREVGGPIAQGIVAGFTREGGGIGAALNRSLEGAVAGARAGLAAISARVGHDVGISLTQALQSELSNIDFTPLARQIAALQGQAAAEQITEQRKQLTDALAKAQKALADETLQPLPSDNAAFAEAVNKRRELQSAITEAERKLAGFERDQRATQLDSVLNTQRTLLQTRIAVSEATQAVADATAAANNTIVESVLAAERNLTQIAGSLADTVGAVLDERLQRQLTSLTHSPIARQISAIDKQLRVEQERQAREGARRSLEEARRNLGQQVQAVRDARAELDRILAAGPDQGTDTRTAAFIRTVRPGESATGGETAEAYQGRVQAAQRAVREAQLAEAEGRRAIRDQERALHDLLLQQRRDLLSRQLTAERNHLTEIEAAHKKSAQRRIADLTEEFNRGMLGVREFTARIQKVLTGEKVTYRGIGRLLGIAVADEFWAQLRYLGYQAQAISAAPNISKLGYSGREGTLIRPLDQIRAAQREVAAAQKQRDDAAIAVARATQDEAEKTRKASERTAAATTALAVDRGWHPISERGASYNTRKARR